MLNPKRELKNCHCGGFPEMERIPCGVTRDRGVRYIVKCYNCGKSFGYAFSEKDAADAWNRRMDCGT